MQESLRVVGEITDGAGDGAQSGATYSPRHPIAPTLAHSPLLNTSYVWHRD
jgi:hypothetical protein